MNNKEKNKFRRSIEWKDFRKQLLAKRGCQCEMCGVTKKMGLNIHHQDEFDYSNLDENNFSILCSRCHQLLEQLLRRKVFNIDNFITNFKIIFEKTKQFKTNNKVIYGGKNDIKRIIS